MAKKALIEKQQRTPKFKVRAYTRCRRCGRPKAVYRKFGLCRICLRDDGARRGNPRRDEGELVRGGRAMTMTDPIADMLTRIRNANTAHVRRRVRDAGLQAEGVPRGHLGARGLHRRLRRAAGRRRPAIDARDHA